MSADPYPGTPSGQKAAADRSRYAVDAQGAMGVQIGEGNTQIIYSYGRLTWTGGVVPPPLADVSGVIDSPYRGLSAFEERDAAFFFGREAAATQVLERLSRQLDGTGLLVVSGVSGAGKSSLLRAGVLPRMRGAGLASAPGAASWPCLLFTPARVPVDELVARVACLAGLDAAAVRRGMDTDPAGFALTARQAVLAQSGASARDPDGSAPERRRLLLVVDQFEQLFTQCADEEQRRAFITALHAAGTAGHGPEQAPAALVVLGVRADFEARCADYPQLADAVQDRYLVTAMTERQLRMAITEPAKKAGHRVDGDLADVLLREVRARHPVSGAGVLPLLSHALDQAWRSRSGEILTLADYERTGGIEGAVAESAQRAYGRLTAAQQVTARQVFTRLTATSSDGVDTADRAAGAELTEGKSPAEARDVEAVLEAFTAERLLTLAAGTVEISHEILLTAWPLLRDTWLAETHADRIVRTRLRGTAAEWAQRSRDRSYLYGGSLLGSAMRTADRIAANPDRHPPITRNESDFLLASSQANRRARRMRQSAVAGLVILLAASLAAAFVAQSQARTAIRQRDVATRQRDLAVSGELAAKGQALIGSDPVLSRLLGLAAWRLVPTAQAHYSMVDAAAQPDVADLSASTNLLSSMAFSPNGHLLATTGAEGAVRLWNASDHQELGPPLMKNAPAGSAVAFSPDGRLLAIGNSLLPPGPGESVRLWNVITHRWLGTPITSKAGISLAGFGAGGKTVVTVDRNILVQWNVDTHRKVGMPVIMTGQRFVVAVATSPNGKVVATVDDHGRVWLWDLRHDREIGKPLIINAASIAFSPNGRLLAAGGARGRVWLWNMARRSKVHVIRSGPGGIESVAFSPDGRTIAAGSCNCNSEVGFGTGAVRLWDTATREEVGSPLVADDGVMKVAFSADGRTVAAAGGNGIAQLWDITYGRQIGPPMSGTATYVNSVAFSPDGRSLAALEDGCWLTLWTMPSRHLNDTARTVACPRHPPSFGGLIGITSVAFSPDGRTLATAGHVGDLKQGTGSPVRLWDTATGHLVTTFPVSAKYAAFSPNGRTLAALTDEGLHVQLWNVATRHKINAFTCNSAAIVVFSPNGHTIAVGGAGCNGNNRIIEAGPVGVLLWDMTTRRQIGFLRMPDAGWISSVVYSPDGDTLATAENTGPVRLWNVATRRQIGAALTSQTSANVETLAFSPDGRTVAGGGKGGRTWLWDVATNRQIGTPLTSPTHADIAALAFSPDGRTLATGGLDGYVRLWDVAFLVNPAASICSSTGRSLTQTEWHHYAQGVPYRRVCPQPEPQNP